jgi:hypothetical protein
MLLLHKLYKTNEAVMAGSRGDTVEAKAERLFQEQMFDPEEYSRADNKLRRRDIPESVDLFNEDLNKPDNDSLLMALGKLYSSGLRRPNTHPLTPDYHLRAALCFIRALKPNNENYKEVLEGLIELESYLEGKEKQELFRLYSGEAMLRSSNGVVNAFNPNTLLFMKFNLGRLHYKGFGTQVNLECARQCFQATNPPFTTAAEFDNNLRREQQKGRPGFFSQVIGGFVGAITCFFSSLYLGAESGFMSTSPVAVANQWGSKVPLLGHFFGFFGSLLWNSAAGLVKGVTGAIYGAGMGAKTGYQRGLRSREDLTHPTRTLHVRDERSSWAFSDAEIVGGLTLSGPTPPTASSVPAGEPLSGTAVACTGLRVSPAPPSSAAVASASSAAAAPGGVGASPVVSSPSVTSDAKPPQP